jgi:two-component system cell cycle response regulator
MSKDPKRMNQTLPSEDRIPAQTKPTKEKPYLLILAGNRMGEMFKLEQEFIIGRDPQCTLFLVDDGISRQHVRLTKNADGNIEVTDLGSTNGTFVNGLAVTSTILRDGDKIQLGSTTILKFSHIDELEESFQSRMYQAALRDPLTGLYNRRYFLEQLSIEISFSLRNQLPLSLIIMDIDRFKSINDTYGHPIGDEVLVGFAAKLMSTLRKEDVLARFGGEEFALLCRGLPIEGGLAAAKRLRILIEMSRLSTSQPALPVTFSAGVAALSPTLSTIDDLLTSADRGLYAAKRTGRNRVCTGSDLNWP